MITGRRALVEITTEDIERAQEAHHDFHPGLIQETCPYSQALKRMGYHHAWVDLIYWSPSGEPWPSQPSHEDPDSWNRLDAYPLSKAIGHRIDRWDRIGEM